MIRLLREISGWGVTSETSPLLAPHLRLTNILLLYMCMASIVQTLICAVLGAYNTALINSTAPVVFASALWMMRAGYINFARVFVFGVCSSVGYVFISSIGPDANFQIIFLFASALAIGMFSIDEKKLLLFGVLSPLVCYFALESTHYAPVFMERTQVGADKLAWMRLFSTISVWSLMVAHFIYFTYDRRRSQENLITSAKMVALGRMAAGVAHEVNNPLQLIMSYAERIKTSTDPKESRSKAEQIQSVAMRIASINKGLLTLSRDAKSDPLVAVSVRSVVENALEFCRARFESKQIDLRIYEIPESLRVVGRETQLAEVFLNVLTNAHDAVETQSERWVEISLHAQKQWIEVSVTDSGQGIDPAIVGRIFDPFFTTKPAGRGTGLGLSICRAVMSDHGGEILYDRKRGRSSFVIRIPRYDDRVSEQPSVEASVV